MNVNDMPIDDAGSWLCTHADDSGKPSPSTRLQVDDTAEWRPFEIELRPPRRTLRCPDCGTYWRIWPSDKVARPSIEWNVAQRSALATKYRRDSRLDISQVVDALSHRFPTIMILQQQGSWIADDDGLWWFSLPDTDCRIQVESMNGDCPFLVEAHGIARLRVSTVDELIRLISEYVAGVSLKDE